MLGERCRLLIDAVDPFAEDFQNFLLGAQIQVKILRQNGPQHECEFNGSKASLEHLIKSYFATDDPNHDSETIGSIADLDRLMTDAERDEVIKYLLNNEKDMIIDMKADAFRIEYMEFVKNGIIAFNDETDAALLSSLDDFFEGECVLEDDSEDWVVFQIWKKYREEEVEDEI